MKALIEFIHEKRNQKSIKKIKKKLKYQEKLYKAYEEKIDKLIKYSQNNGFKFK